MQAYQQGPEGVAGAIGKLADGLRPPPRLRRGEIPSLPPSAEEGEPSAKRMVEDTPHPITKSATANHAAVALSHAVYTGYTKNDFM